MKNTTVQFSGSPLTFPSWYEELWMKNRHTTINPLTEAEQAQKIRRPIGIKLLIVLGISACLLVACLLFLTSLPKVSIGATVIVIMLGTIFFGGLGVLHYWSSLIKIKTPISDAYTNDLRELYFELRDAFLGFDAWTFGSRWQTENALRADLGSYLTKAAKQIDAKHRGGLLIDSERERMKFNKLHAAALKFGLVNPLRRSYYPSDSRV